MEIIFTKYVVVFLFSELLVETHGYYGTSSYINIFTFKFTHSFIDTKSHIIKTNTSCLELVEIVQLLAAIQECK